VELIFPKALMMVGCLQRLIFMKVPFSGHIILTLINAVNPLVATVPIGNAVLCQRRPILATTIRPTGQILASWNSASLLGPGEPNPRSACPHRKGIKEPTNIFCKNRITPIGRLGKDTETRFTTNGTAYSRFTIATNVSCKHEDSGQYRTRTEWHVGVVWTKLAQTRSRGCRRS
jgi:hypothetical protein